ncbi:MAG: YwaF family protein [Erysipelotrichaceae bacterium]|nr:YwaF family protein [Erysipelotrichaceae bacterium]
MNHFWTHRDNIPEGCGYGQFTRTHFFLMAATGLLIAVITCLYKDADQTQRLIILRSIGATLLASDIIKMIVIGVSDVKLSYYLPLEPCSFATYAIICDSIIPNNDFLPEVLLTLFMPAAIMAIIVPTTQPLPVFNFFTIHQFLFHGLIVAYVIARFASGEIPISLAGVWRSIPRICVLVITMYIFDTVFDRDYMFLRDPYGNPLLQMIWDKTGGGIKYTAGLVGFAIVIIHIFFVIFKIIEQIFIV